MIGIKTRVDIDRPAHDVYRFLVSGENFAEWMPGVESVELVRGAPGEVGATYRQAVKLMGMKMEGTVEYLECEPGKRVVTKSESGPMVMRSLLELAEDDGKTKLTMTVDPGPAGAAMGLMIKSQGKQSLQKLKEALER